MIFLLLSTNHSFLFNGLEYKLLFLKQFMYLRIWRASRQSLFSRGFQNSSLLDNPRSFDSSTFPSWFQPEIDLISPKQPRKTLVFEQSSVAFQIFLPTVATLLNSCCNTLLLLFFSLSFFTFFPLYIPQQFSHQYLHFLASLQLILIIQETLSIRSKHFTSFPSHLLLLSFAREIHTILYLHHCRFIFQSQGFQGCLANRFVLH